MREELDRLPALHKRLRESVRNLSARLSRGSNPAEELRALLASCQHLSDELGGALTGQHKGAGSDGSAAWKGLREVAERGRDQLAQVKERVKRSSPATRELEALGSLLDDLAAMLSEAGTVLPEAGVTVGEDVRARLSQVRSAIDALTWSFVRTTPFASIVREGKAVDFDLKDLLLIGALAHADVLLVGKTGSGKTKLEGLTCYGRD